MTAYASSYGDRCHCPMCDDDVPSIRYTSSKTRRKHSKPYRAPSKLQYLRMLLGGGR